MQRGFQDRNSPTSRKDSTVPSSYLCKNLKYPFILSPFLLSIRVRVPSSSSLSRLSVGLHRFKISLLFPRLLRIPCQSPLPTSSALSVPVTLPRSLFSSLLCFPSNPSLRFLCRTVACSLLIPLSLPHPDSLMLPSHTSSSPPFTPPPFPCCHTCKLSPPLLLSLPPCRSISLPPVLFLSM